jgi:guanylate kinase
MPSDQRYALSRLAERTAQRHLQLLLIDGASGAGKSTLLNHLRRLHQDRVDVGSKYTTRAKRVGDNDWEFFFVDNIPPSATTYSFKSVGNEYSVDAVAMSTAFRADKTYCVTCTDGPTLAKLRQDFGAVIVYIFRPLSEQGLDMLLASRGASFASDAGARRNELSNVVPDYISKMALYDHVILNVGSEELLGLQMDAVLAMYFR